VYDQQVRNRLVRLPACAFFPPRSIVHVASGKLERLSVLEVRRLYELAGGQPRSGVGAHKIDARAEGHVVPIAADDQEEWQADDHEAHFRYYSGSGGRQELTTILLHVERTRGLTSTLARRTTSRRLRWAGSCSDDIPMDDERLVSFLAYVLDHLG